ncbi:MAG: endonuclease III, partial [Bacteroidales bacterium]|nr:endonuclease III [Bacteroidales bacterium]
MKKRYADIVGWFEENMPLPKPELHFDNAWQLLVAVMLSAQCTDKRVNMVTPALFEAYPTPEAMASAGFEEVLQYTKSVSYPNSKTQHLIDAAKMIMSDFGGEVP